MLNGHSPEKPYIPNTPTEFATKTDVYVLETKIQGIVRECGGMATAINKFGEILNKVEVKLESLVIKKGINDGLKAFAYKCLMVFGGFIGTLLTLHVVGIIKIIGKWIIHQ